jgi:cytochrome b561
MSSVIVDRYSKLARVLHWVSAVVIIWATITGIYMAVWAGPAVKQLISFINISVTSLLAPVFAVRIAYALCSRKPAPLELPRRERIAARIGHFLLYAMTTIVLASGIVMMEQDIRIFNWLTIPQPLDDHRLTAIFAAIHRVSSSLLGLMIAGHIAAVIRHQHRGRPVLKRMSPGRETVPLTSVTDLSQISQQSVTASSSTQKPTSLL